MLPSEGLRILTGDDITDADALEVVTANYGTCLKTIEKLNTLQKHIKDITK